MNRTALFAVLACSGCVIAEPEVATTSVALQIEDGCPPSECGSNSSVINGVYFYEVPTKIGETNTEGVTLLGYVGLPAGTTRLDARHNELVARNDDSTVVITGPDLVDSGFILLVNGVVVPLYIRGFHRSLDYWADPAGKPLSSYTFEYIKIENMTSTPTPLCTVVDLADGEAALDAFVFEGDRYNPTTKLVSEGRAAAGWYNLACMGGAPAKSLRMRGAAAGNDATHVTSLDQNQALFNMWIANYCGDGTSFTVPGEPLLVRDINGWIAPASAWSWEKETQLDEYEAVWGPDGAVCLDRPRRDDSAPGYRSVIADHCKSVGKELPTCDRMFPDNWKSRGYYASANPTGS